MGFLVRVAIYLRVSTTEQAKEGYSLGAQLERLRNFCRAREWEVAREYIDDGHSGRSIKRPAYQKMMEEKDGWDMILVVKMDRIHRNSKNFMEMMDDLRKWGKEFSSMQESLDTSTAMGRFVVDIIQRIAQLESEQIGERVYVGMKQKASTEGGILGFAHPYGYDYENGELKINSQEAEGVKLMFELYLVENSTEDIAVELEKRGFPSKRNGVWSARTVGKILKNPVYCGYLEWEEHVYKGNHEKIIEIKVFNEVQELIFKNTRNKKLKRKPLKLPEAPKEEGITGADSKEDNQVIEGASHDREREAVCT
ncbi:MAG: recombinase family protein [Thermoplasmata archaeon]|nr:MAG: recombinase family protein [Thermoplasmata archaeon]